MEWPLLALGVGVLGFYVLTKKNDGIIAPTPAAPKAKRNLGYDTWLDIKDVIFDPAYNKFDPAFGFAGRTTDGNLRTDIRSANGYGQAPTSAIVGFV